MRRYLSEFLSDRPGGRKYRRCYGKLILHGIILRTRPAKEREEVRQHLDTGGLNAAGVDPRAKRNICAVRWANAESAGCQPDLVQVEVGMRYGNPSIASALSKLKAAHCNRILLLPMYPQYAAST